MAARMGANRIVATTVEARRDVYTREPGTGNQQPATSNQLIADCRLLIADC
jgi:hypothetical protein